MTDTNDTIETKRCPYDIALELLYRASSKTLGEIEDLIKEAGEYYVAQALADAAPKVEWVPVGVKSYHAYGDGIGGIYITDGVTVRHMDYGYLPKWVTHWAPCPPRTLPAPPQEAR